MLKLHTLNSTGEKQTIYYNPYTFRFFHDAQCEDPVVYPFPKVEYDYPDSPVIAILPLGYNCPNRCVYCMQHKMRNPPLDMKKLKYVLSEYVEKGLQKVHFLGGEPLLQWSVVQDIMRSFPTLQFSIITNGIHLNLDIAETLADHHCTVTISHDGESQRIQRGINILDPHTTQNSIVQWLSREVPVNIASVICGSGTTMEERYYFFTSNTEIEFNAINIRPMIPFTPFHLQLVTGKDNWNKYFATLLLDVYALAQNDKWKNGNIDILEHMVRLSMNENTEWNSTYSHCPIFNPNFVTLNQNGYVQYCYNCDKPVTTIYTKKYMHKERLQKCHNCPVLLTCTGMCRIIEEEHVWKMACHRTFYYHLAYLIYFVHRTYDLFITEIEGEFSHAVDGHFRVSAYSTPQTDITGVCSLDDEI